MSPIPGTATERDVLAVERREGRLCELVDGILVEKIMGSPESFLAIEIGRHIGNFADAHDLGFPLGADGMTRLMPGLVRIPDVSFFSWQHFPTKEIPTDPITPRAPDLAVEVISKGNTRGEIRRKLKEYFLGGTHLVWVVNPKKRLVQVHTAPDRFSTVAEGNTLDGGDVLPGFALALRSLFRRLPPTTARSRRKRDPR
jgi:Uma2 family endonuclease